MPAFFIAKVFFYSGWRRALITGLTRDLYEFIGADGGLGIFPGGAIFCVPPKPKIDAVKSRLISSIMVCRFVPAGKLAAFLRPSFNNFQPNIMLSNRMKKVIMLEINASKPAQKNIWIKLLIVLVP
jgi:hypothetical protein